jgi:uncharacterized protein (DUF362 family)
MGSKVSIVKAEPETADRAVEESIELIDGLSDVVGKRNVSIKPNLCKPCSSQAGYTTDLRIVEGVIEKINKTSQCNIQVVETNNAEASADETFRKLGYLHLESEFRNVKCTNLSKDERKLRMSLNGRIFKTLQVPESMIFSDYMISVAKLKTHVDYYYTGVLKNAYGLLLSRQRRLQYHGFMHEALTDLNMVYKPDLAIIDGMIGMEGFGPVEGRPKHVGVIIASKDPVAADAVGAEIAGIKPSKIKYLRYAEKNGLGEIKDIEIVGSSIEEVKTSFDFIPLKWYLLGKISLSLQRTSRRISNLGRTLSLTRSAMSTIGYSELRNRLSVSDLLRLARDSTFKIED